MFRKLRNLQNVRNYALSLLLLVLIGVVVVTALWRPRQQASVIREPPASFELAIPQKSRPLAWLAWDDSTFARARRVSMPVAALMTAEWSETCVIYEAMLAADTSLTQALSQVIAVRVDIDRRPDVHLRYHQEFDSLPTWIFLTPGGKLWDLAGLLPPAELLVTLRELRADPSTHQDAGLALLESLPGALPSVRASAPASAEFVSEYLAYLETNLPRAPHEYTAETPWLDSHVYRFLYEHQARAPSSRSSARSKRLLLETLHAILGSDLLQPGGALFSQREASGHGPSRAVFLETQARLLGILSLVSHWDASFASAARDMEEFLRDHLFDHQVGLYRASLGTLRVDAQGWPLLASSERAALAAVHDSLGAPQLATWYPTCGNAELWSYNTALFSPDRFLARANDLVTNGLVPHGFERNEAGALQALTPHTLSSHLALGQALLPTRPRLSLELARLLLREFVHADTGLFTDVARPVAAPERMTIAVTPLAANAEALWFLSRLHDQTAAPDIGLAIDTLRERLAPRMWPGEPGAAAYALYLLRAN